MRLFFALPLPTDVKERLQPTLDAARRAAGESVGFTRLEQIHFTLAFLGEQPSPDKALAAGEVLRDQDAFELAIGGAGAFPNTARPRVLWLGVTEGAAQLMVAADRLRRALRDSGFMPEERPFRPHLTVGRVRPRGEKTARQALAAIAPGELARCTVRHACLMQSVLGKSGATHTLVRAYEFR
ncbi:MAG TPA: RNA 2',3'-cyclic phosphodiesterase [Myxococcales bacterium]|jgi:2'-5' RNA ligase|nr:RNA 2',3'-cyclic phosphodiesterase [Myxococcales bacterium]